MNCWSLVNLEATTWRPFTSCLCSVLPAVISLLRPRLCCLPSLVIFPPHPLCEWVCVCVYTHMSSAQRTPGGCHSIQPQRCHLMADTGNYNSYKSDPPVRRVLCVFCDETLEFESTWEYIWIFIKHLICVCKCSLCWMHHVTFNAEGSPRKQMMDQVFLRLWAVPLLPPPFWTHSFLCRGFILLPETTEAFSFLFLQLFICCITSYCLTLEQNNRNVSVSSASSLRAVTWSFPTNPPASRTSCLSCFD